MSIVKGFINIPALINNTPGQTSQFGELSPRSLTFSKEKGIYTDLTANVELGLTTFFCVDDLGEMVTLPTAIANGILALANRVYGLYTQNQMPDFQDGDELATFLAAEFLDPNYVDITVGDLIQSTSETDKLLPDWVSWRMNVGSDSFETRIWFVDGSFQAQYDEYEIAVIPPVEPVDRLNGTPAAVKQALDSVTVAMNYANIEANRGEHGYTHLEPYPLLWNDPDTNSQATLPSMFTILVWGPQGNSAENINSAIIDYLQNNSSHPLSVWEKIYPSLFAKTEFYLVPYWLSIGIPEQNPLTGIYSGFTAPQGTEAKLQQYAPGYSEPHIRANYTIGDFQYNSLKVASIGSLTNADGAIKLNQLYPDYINVGTTTTDFRRMAQATQDWALFMTSLLELAERATPTTVMNAPFSRVTRNGNLYVSGRHGDANFICLTRHSYN